MFSVCMNFPLEAKAVSYKSQDSDAKQGNRLLGFDLQLCVCLWLDPSLHLSLLADKSTNQIILD